MRKAIAILPVVSAIYPMITGATAPPTIVMISHEEANLVFVPASLNASEKIVGNMMLSPRYRAKNAMRDKVPLHTTTIVSIRSTPYCKSQNNVVPLHGGIIFLILRQEYAI